MTFILRKKDYRKFKENFDKFFFHPSLESSETHFDIVASKIGAKLKKLVIYDDILVEFLQILSTKSIISQKIKIANIGKIFFS